MKSKKIIWIAVIILAAALILAAVFYHFLSQKIMAERAAETITEETAVETTAKPSEETDIVSFKEEFESMKEPETAESEEKPVSEESSQKDLEAATDFTVETMDGAEIKLSEMAGKPVIVNFWATWCPPCKAELPHFQEMYKEYGDQIQFMMVDLMDGSRETQTTLQAFLLAQGYTFPVYADRTGEASSAYQIYSIPMTICVTAEGNLLSQRIGSLSKEELQSMIDSLLED